MRKLKLLMATLALILGWSNAWAQVTDVSSKLVASGTNWPTFNPTSTHPSDANSKPWRGENVTAGGVKGACTLETFKFAEVYYDQTAGTVFTLSQTITGLDNGIYKFRIAAFARKENIWGNDNGKSDASNVRLSANKSSTYITSNVMAYYELVTEVTDGTLTLSISGVDKNNKSNWIGYTDATLLKLFSGSSYPADVKELVTNWDFTGCENDNFPGWTISNPKNGNAWKNGDTRVEYWIGSAVNGSFDYYQILTGLPTGRYTLSASMWNSTNSEAGASFSGGGTCGVYGTSSGVTVFAGVTVDGDACNTYTTDEIIVTNGELRLGVKNNTTMTARWFGVDWIKLNYLGPVVESGTYYLYDATNEVFASRGADFGTRFTVDKYGMPIVWDNWSQRIRFVDSSDRYLYFDNTPSSSWLYTDALDDKSRYNYFAFVGATGGYYLKDNNQTVYVKHDGSVTTPTTNQVEAAIWTLKNPTEYNTIIAAYPTDNKTAVITAASLTAETDAAGFESWLAANRAAKDKTSSVGTARFAGSKGDWTWTGTRENYSSSAINYGTDYAEAFQRSGDWSQTISGLSNGIYKVTVNAFERATGYADCNTLGTTGWEPVTSYFEANGQQVQLKSWYSEKTGTNNPNNTSEAVTAFNSDKYKNEVYAYVSDGTLTLKLNKPSCMWSSWVLFNNVILTYYDTTVSDEDATDILDEANEQMAKPMLATLRSAISDAKDTFDGSRTVPNYNALRAAIDASATSVESYAAMKTNYLDPLKAALDANNFYSSSAKSTVYDAYKTQYDEGTIANATAAALSWKSGTRYEAPVNNLLMDIWKIGNTTALTNNSGFYINSWSTESAGEAPAKDFANPFYEYWVGSGSLAAATIVGTMTGLSANALYKVTANVRVQGTNEKVANSITMQVGDGAETDVTAGTQIGETDRYIGSYSAIGMTDGDGKLTLTFNVAGSSNISWLAFRDVNYEEVTEVAEAKNYLNTRISTATTLYNSGANVGTGVFQIPTVAATTFSGAISTAQGVYDDGAATLSGVQTAITNMNNAINTYNNVTLNAPDAEKHYNIIVATSGHAKNGNGIIVKLGATSANNPTGYEFNASATPNVNLAQAIKFTQVSGNTYNISFEAAEGIVYLTYGSLNGSAAGWKNAQIQGTTDAEKKGEFRISATSTANVFNIINTVTGTNIDCQDGGNIYTDENITNDNFSIAEASQASVAITISSAVKYATRIFPFTPSLPSGIKAYSCEESDGYVLTLVEEDTPAANVPYILEAEDGYTGDALTGWGTAAAETYTVGWLTGVYTSRDAINGTYVLQNNGKVGFYKVDTSDVIPTVGAYRCYLSVPSGARPAFFFGDETTGIDAINGLTSGSATIYSVDGHKLPALQKGLNIIKTDGKTYKVMVK